MIKKISNGVVAVWINPIGAELHRIQKDGRDYLWNGDDALWAQRAPMLFPIVGQQKGDCAVIGGCEYHIPKHGFLMQTFFNTLAHTEDTLLLRTVSSDETRKMYPFNFQIDVKFQLKAATLHQDIIIHNTGKEEMIYGFGLHPGFMVADREDHFAKCSLDFHQDLTLLRPSLTADFQWDFNHRILVRTQNGILLLNDEIFDGKPIILDMLNSNRVTAYQDDGTALFDYCFSGFQYFGMWHANHAPFVCLEPWTSHSAFLPGYTCLEDNPTMCRLHPGCEDMYHTELILH